MDVFPTANGGHTYIGFITEQEPQWTRRWFFWKKFRKGIVRPTQPGDFALLTKEFQEDFKRGFTEKGYLLVAEAK